MVMEDRMETLAPVEETVAPFVGFGGDDNEVDLFAS